MLRSGHHYTKPFWWGQIKCNYGINARFWRCDVNQLNNFWTLDTRLCSEPLICACMLPRFCVTKWFFFSLHHERFMMKLIQSHAWMSGYHTPSCPFNLALLSSLSPPQACNHNLLVRACLGACDSRKSFNVDSDCLVVGYHARLFQFAPVLPLFEPLYLLFLILDFSTLPSTKQAFMTPYKLWLTGHNKVSKLMDILLKDEQRKSLHFYSARRFL